MINDGKVFNPFYIGRPKRIKYARINSPFNEQTVKRINDVVTKAMNRQNYPRKKRLAGEDRFRAGGKLTKKPFKTEQPRNGLYVPSEMRQPSYLSIRPSSRSNYSRSSSSMLRPSQSSFRASRRPDFSTTLRAKMAVLKAGEDDRKSRSSRRQAAGSGEETSLRSSRLTGDDVSRSTVEFKPSDHYAHNYSVTAMKTYQGSQLSGSTKSVNTGKISPSFRNVANSIKRQLAESMSASKVLVTKMEALTKRLQTVLSNK